MVKALCVLWLGLVLTLSPALAQIKIMPLGDSVTQGELTQGSYRKLLWDLLINAGFPVNFVGSSTSFYRCGTYTGPAFDMDHEGHWGWRVDQILDGTGRSDNCAVATAGEGLADWLTAYTPDAVLIHLGTNDMNQGQTVASTITEIGQVVQTLRNDNPNVVIFLAQLIPSRSSTANANINLLNPEIAIYASANSSTASPIIVVDQNSGYDPQADNYDSFHPGPTGQTKMANNWFDAFQTHYSGILPVEWTRIEAVQEGDRARISWSVSGEINNQGFEVEHRAPFSETFEKVAYLPSQNPANGQAAYEAEVTGIFQGRHYFRVKQVDTDGKHSYSNKVTLLVRTRFLDQLLISHTVGEPFVLVQAEGIVVGDHIRMELTDLVGKVVANHSATYSGEPIRLATGSLAPGLYQVRAFTGARMIGAGRFLAGR